MAATKKQKHNWYERNKKKLKNRREKQYFRTKKGFLCIIFNILSKSYMEKANGHYFPIFKKDWVKWFLINPQFNHVFNVWERGNYKREDQPYFKKLIVEKGKPTWMLENLMAVPFSEIKNEVADSSNI